MGGFSALPLVVEVAFGAAPLDTGTLTWTDITDQVRRTSGVDFSRGWDAEAGEPLAGRLTLTLNNESGDFTPGETGTYGEVRNRLPIRVSATIGTATGNALTYDEAAGWYDMTGATYDDAEIGTVVLWTGLVESWRIFWENGVRSQVAVTAVDRWAAIRRLKLGPDIYASRLSNQSPLCNWPMFDASERAVASGGVTGADLIPFTSTAFPSGSVQWAQQAVPWYASGRAPTFGEWDVLRSTGVPSGSASAVSISMWLRQSSVQASAFADIVILGPVGMQPSDTTVPNTLRLGWESNGSSQWGPRARFYYTTNGSGVSKTVTDPSPTAIGGQWVHVAVTLSISAGTATITVYRDGVSVASSTQSGSTWDADRPTLHVFGNSDTYLTNVAHLSVFGRALTADEVLAQYASTQGGTAGDTADERGALLVGLAPTPPTLSTTGTFTATMSTQDLADKSLADALFECATAERGTIYVNTDGWPVLTSRSWRVGSAVAFTIPATALGRDVGWTLDDQQLTNSATVDRMVGDTSAAQVRAKNDTSVATYGEQNKALQVWLDTDAQLLERANAEANIDAVARPRSSELMVDLLTKGATIPAATLLGADIGDRIAVSGLPAEAPGSTEFYIETVADRVTHTGWERTFTVTPRADYFTVEDATYGEIDSVFVLAF